MCEIKDFGTRHKSFSIPPKHALRSTSPTMRNKCFNTKFNNLNLLIKYWAMHILSFRALALGINNCIPNAISNSILKGGVIALGNVIVNTIANVAINTIAYVVVNTIVKVRSKHLNNNRLQCTKRSMILQSEIPSLDVPQLFPKKF